MGNYTIVIQGHGINHNGDPKDADEMAAAFVEQLRASNQSEVKGYFCYGIDLADDIVEKLMPNGVGYRKAEPLRPLCTAHQGGSDGNDAANPADACGAAATHAKASGDVFFGYLCPVHEAQVPENHRSLVVEL